VLDFLKSVLGTRASPRVLLDTGGDDPDNRPAVKEEVPPYIVVCHFIYIYIYL